MLVVVGASNNTLGVSPFLFYFLDGSKKHINLIDNNLKNYLVAALPRWEFWVHRNLYEKYYEEFSIIYPPDDPIDGPYNIAQTSALAAADEELGNNPDYCPKWPYYITNDDVSVPLLERYKTADESIENAIFYLGWALHIMQDITVPQNAANIADAESETFEKEVERGRAKPTI